MSELPQPSNTFNNWSASLLTGFLCGLLIYITISLVEGRVQPTFRDVVIGLVGFITAKLSTSYDFYYGTSSVNKKQVDTISTMAATQAAATPNGSTIATISTPDVVVPLKEGDIAAVQPDPLKGDKT